jgi:hypothetical protein
MAQLAGILAFDDDAAPRSALRFVTGGTMKKFERLQLNAGELATLDALIAVAQQIGINLDTLDDDDCDAHATEGAAETVEARHDGVIFRYVEHEVLPRLRGLASQVEGAPTLRKLIELRGAATRLR